MWQLLLRNGASGRKEEGTRNYWATLTPEQQQAAFTTISRKLAAKAFVHYDPIRAIQENIWQVKSRGPTNYNGKKLDPKTKYVIAFYDGQWGTYTLEEAQLFNLKIKE